MQRLVGWIHREKGDDRSALRYYHRALEILEQGPETVELARTISAISQLYMGISEDDEAIAWGKRALAMAERLGAEDVVVHALNNIGSCMWQKGDSEEGLRLLQVHAAAGRADLALEAAERILGFAGRLPHPSQPATAPLFYACQWLASQPGPQAAERAHACLSELERTYQHHDSPETGAFLVEARGILAAEEGHPEEAAEQLRLAATAWKTLERPYDRARAPQHMRVHWRRAATLRQQSVSATRHELSWSLLQPNFPQS